MKVGDTVLTASGRVAPVRWIGRRRLDLTAHPRPELVQPIQIAAQAFAPGLPARDLVVSPGHCVFAEGALIPAGELVNGRTITRLDRASVEYLHVELDRHDLVLAESLPTESYLDTGRRGDFANGGEPLTLHPTFAAMAHEAACAPIVTTGSAVEAVRTQLARRADVMAGEAKARPGALTERLRLWTRRA